jgi:hypothetical protein
MRLFAVSLILSMVIFAQSQIPYGDGDGPTFAIRNVDASYSGSYSSLHSVVFRNFTFHFSDESSMSDFNCSLKNGHYRYDEDLGHVSLDLVSTHYLGRSASSKTESVLVLLSNVAAGGSSREEGMAQVYSLSNGKLRVVQEID